MQKSQDKPSGRVRSVMEDPSAQALARIYADALLDASGAGVEGTLEEFGSFVDDVLEAHPDFASILVSGVVGRDEKVSLIERVVGPFGSEMFTNFLRVLARHDRLALLPVILHESRVRHEWRTGKQRVRVSTAHALSDSAAGRIREMLEETLPFDPIIESRIDAALLGGMIIRVGDTIYDSSLRTRLQQMRDRLHKRTIHEIQSGRDRFSHPSGD